MKERKVNVVQSYEDAASKVYTELVKDWKKPGLLISVQGGAKKMSVFDSNEKQDFRDALMKVAKHSNTWITTAGVSNGVSELTGEAAKNFRILNNKKDFKLLGFVAEDKLTNEVKTDQNHDCILLVTKNDKPNSHEPSVNLRTEFENLVKKSECPIVQILIEGGKGAISTIAEGLKNEIPLIVFKGSLRAADYIAQYIHDKEESNDKEFKGTKNSMDDIHKKKDLVTIIDVKDIKHNLDSKIAEAAFSIKTPGNYQEDYYINLLNLHMSYNRYDLTKQHIEMFLNLYNFKEVQEEEEKLEEKREEVFKRPWNENLFHFVYIFSLYGVNILEKFTDDFKNLLKTGTTPNEKECLKICNFDENKIEEKFKHLSKNIVSYEFSTTKSKKNNSLGSTSKTYQSIEKVSNKLKERDQLTRNRFLMCIVLQRFEMARIIWKNNEENDFLGLALTGCVTCHSMAAHAGKQGEQEIKNVYMNEYNRYLELAEGILSEAQLTDKKKAQKLIRMEVQYSDVKTPMEIASKHGLMPFLNHSVCQTRITAIWYGRISPYTSIWKLALGLAFFPFICFVTFTDKIDEDEKKKCDDDEKKQQSVPKTDDRKENEHQKQSDSICTDNSVNDIEMQNVHDNENETKKLKKQSDSTSADNSKNNGGNDVNEPQCDVVIRQPKFCEKVKYFYSAPIIRFLMSVLSYIAFLILFTYVNLVDLAPVKTQIQSKMIPEFVVYVYVISLVIEEIRQLCTSSEGSVVDRIRDWWSSYWNKFDFINFVIFIISVIIRYIPNIDFVYARTMYCLSLSLFYMRFLQFYMPVKALGPKVIMISKMIRDVIFFIAIYVIVVFAYGTYAQGLLFPNSNLTSPLINSIYYKPYWQTYGELSLDYVEGDISVNNVKPQKNTTVIIAFALFMLCSNVLLLNLLIAMFGNTYARIESVSRQIWGYYRYHLIKEYYERPICPPPFNLIELVIRVIKHTPCCNKAHESKFLLSRKTCNEENLPEFARLCTENYLRDHPLIQSENKSQLKQTLANED